MNEFLLIFSLLYLSKGCFNDILWETAPVGKEEVKTLISNLSALILTISC